jgi:hypothetical protein
MTVGHLFFELLLVVCTVSVDSELRGVSMYVISADLFQVQKISYFTLVPYFFIGDILLNIAYRNCRWNLQKYPPPPINLV